MHRNDLKEKVLELYNKGVSVREIVKESGVSRATLFRWIKENEIVTVENEITSAETETVSKRQIIPAEKEVSSVDEWYAQSLQRCVEIAQSNRKLQDILTERLEALLLDSDDLNVKELTALSSAIARHCEIEWRARGFDFLFYKSRRNLLLENTNNNF
ncbi:MAG: helix-turn-helix domain containing protein [Brasilonema angustatum HA4187-MV1]|jgi:transposase|nr:helix-turn-helix domain containing protein [Brasilonema angustatum HA4187-MV1]